MKTPLELACIIDDDNIYVSLISKIIKMKKLAKNLLVFRNGREALSYFDSLSEDFDAKKIPDIIFLDLNMPIMDGWQFIKAFGEVRQKLDKKVELYLVSSSIDPRDLQKANGIEEISDYLLKPLKINDIEQIFEIAS
ncbi:response regulator [Sungkyunkwania multivorans]|uniref:Response regulator n=1 Tax=Sungkyunkwania multivorans TaxID=1173618 RepID=A0ABW3D390_9FLAO